MSISLTLVQGVPVQGVNQPVIVGVPAHGSLCPVAVAIVPDLPIEEVTGSQYELKWINKDFNGFVCMPGRKATQKVSTRIHIEQNGHQKATTNMEKARYNRKAIVACFLHNFGYHFGHTRVPSGALGCYLAYIWRPFVELIGSRTL